MSEIYDFDLLCIGSGPAGHRAAIQAAKLGRRVAVVEKRQFLGGMAIEMGTIPSKALREAVLFFAGVRDRFGPRAGAQGGKPTAEQLMERVDAIVRHEAAIAEHQLLRNDVVHLCGEASFKDPHTVLVESDGTWRAVTAANILIAVGTRAAPPPGISPDGETILTSDDMVRLKRIPRTMAVVGAGVIGVEYASIFAAIGTMVTIIDGRREPLEFLDGEIVDELIHQLRDRNVSFRLGEVVKRLDITEGPPRRSVIKLESGKVIASDLVLFSAGRIGATDRLNLEAVGLQANARGRLEVDQCFRTCVPHIFAAGDIIGFPSLAATSRQQGRLAACHALGVAPRQVSSHFPVGIYSVPEVSMVGAPEQELTERQVPYETGIAHYREIARGQLLGDEQGLFKMLFQRDDGRLLGVHIVGAGATELIHIGQAVLDLGGGIDYFLDAVFNYPTLAECYKVAAFNAATKLGMHYDQA